MDSKKRGRRKEKKQDRTFMRKWPLVAETKPKIYFLFRSLWLMIYPEFSDMSLFREQNVILQLELLGNNVVVLYIQFSSSFSWIHIVAASIIHFMKNLHFLTDNLGCWYIFH